MRMGVARYWRKTRTEGPSKNEPDEATPSARYPATTTHSSSAAVERENRRSASPPQLP